MLTQSTLVCQHWQTKVAWNLVYGVISGLSFGESWLIWSYQLVYRIMECITFHISLAYQWYGETFRNSPKNVPISSSIINHTRLPSKHLYNSQRSWFWPLVSEILDFESGQGPTRLPVPYKTVHYEVLIGFQLGLIQHPQSLNNLGPWRMNVWTMPSGLFTLSTCPHSLTRLFIWQVY